MIDYEGLRQIVAKGLKNYLGCPVIRSNQNKKPPAYPYVLYTITTLKSQTTSNALNVLIKFLNDFFFSITIWYHFKIFIANKKATSLN